MHIFSVNSLEQLAKHDQIGRDTMFHINQGFSTKIYRIKLESPVK